MILNNKCALALAGLIALITGAAFADDQALIDALVRTDLKNDSYLFEEQLLARYKTDWFSITVAPSLFIANAAGYGHDTVANGPAGNFSSVNTGGFTAPVKSTAFLQFLDGTGEERDLFVV
jgi:hypothetical protein